METTRPNRGRMAFLLLLLSGHFAAAQLIPGAAENTNLDCTTDMEHMFCRFKAQNCSEYSLRILKYEEEYDCPLRQCDGEHCCCSVKISLIVFGQTFTGTVRKQNTTLESKSIYITDSFKPKTPTIMSVNESNGNFEVRWTTNMDYILSDSLKAEVTFYKKGTTEKVSKLVTPAQNNELPYYEISGQQLDPGAAYVVSVRSFTTINDKFSDSSKEWEFKTPASYYALLLGIAVGLSVCAVIIVAAVNGCYVKLKNKWWDQFPRPKVVVLHVKKPPVFTPEKPSISSLHLQYTTLTTNEKCEDLKPEPVMRLPFPLMMQMLMQNKNLPADPYKDFASVSQTMTAEDGPSTSGSSSIFNQTYSMLLPNCHDQKKKGDGSSLQRQSETLLGSSDKSSIVTDLDRQTCLFPAQDCSSLLPTSRPCQSCNADQPTASSCSVPTYSNSVASHEIKNINVTEPPSESPADTIPNFGKPFFCTVPAGSHGFFPMEDNYKPFRRQVEEDVFMSGDAEPLPSDFKTHFNQDSVTFKPLIPHFLSLVQSGQLINMSSDDRPIKVISDYHSV